MIGSFHCRRAKSPLGTVPIINLLGKGLSPRACMGDGGSIWWAPAFGLSLFLPWFWHFKMFLWLSRTSQQYKPTPKNFKGGANLLFRGLVIANTYASSMSSWVSYRFQVDSSYTCGRAKTMRKRFEWTRICFEKGKKKLCFQTNTDTSGQSLSRILSFTNRESGKFQSFHVQTAWQYK